MAENKTEEKIPDKHVQCALCHEHTGGPDATGSHSRTGRSHGAELEGSLGASRPATGPALKRTVYYHILRLALGGVFLYASLDKILHPQAFAQAVYNYQILPDAAVNLAALILPWLELLLGLCLVVGIWMPGATVTTTGLLFVFIGALVFNLARGLDIHCGCFSTEATGEPAGLMTVVRDLVFLAFSVYLTVFILFLRPAALKSSTPGHSPGKRASSRSRR